jgi:hypothetical protein
MGRCFSNQSDKRSADVQVPAAWLSESSTLMRASPKPAAINNTMVVSPTQ